MSDHTLYSITHRASGREYIGITSLKVRRRWQAHARAKTYLGSAIRKHGASAFDFKVEAVLPSRAELHIAERIAIALYRPAFNATAGGEGALGLKRNHTAEHRAKIAATLTGRKRPQCERDRISAAQKGRKNSPEHIEATARANRGRKHTAKARANYAAAAQRRAATPEGAAHLKQAAARAASAKRGSSFTHTEASRAKMAAAARARASTDTGRAHLLAASARGAAARRSGK